MKFSLTIVAFCATAASGFAPASVSRTRLAPLNVATMQGTIDLQENVQRDVFSLQQWAEQYGAQVAPGFELTTMDGADYSVITNQAIPAGQAVLYVPAQICMSSNAVQQEFGGSLIATENILSQIEGDMTRTPLFRLMIKILAEYEKGQASPYFPWLNSMPRLFYNGVSMTDACFDCLPPYAGWLSMLERNNYAKFAQALRQGNLPLDPSTINNDQVTKWAYNIALTRFTEVWQPTRQKLIAPLADMFNHATNPNVVITFDDEGNGVATTMVDVPAGSPLTISMGDPSNPTPLFAKYGFLYNDSETIFCKAMHLKNEIDILGYDFKDLLFSTATGDIAPKVWDLFLYKILENDQDNLGQFYTACKTNDEATKQGYHGHYFSYTLQAIKDHVDSILRDVDNLSMVAQSYDLNTHPRVPVILAHNNLVRDTFGRVKAQLDTMG